MFDNFWESYESIQEGLGFDLFSLSHLLELAVAVLFVIAVTTLYKKADEKARKRLSFAFVVAVLLDELFKHVGLLAYGNWLPDYLPLHLCSVNIFMIVIFHYTKNQLVGNFLWSLCIPGALLALVFPNWKMLPVLNFMHLHSTSIHVLLLAYPIMMIYAGEIKRDYRLIPKILVLLILVTIPGLLVNLGYDTNFMFLNRPAEGSPLELFEQWFGSHLWGFVVLLPVVLALMYMPIKKKGKQNEND